MKWEFLPNYLLPIYKQASKHIQPNPHTIPHDLRKGEMEMSAIAGGFTTTGVILVLFILLVIVGRAIVI